MKRTNRNSRAPTNRTAIRPYLEILETRLAPANVDVFSYHYDQFLTGQNLQETILHPGPTSDATALNSSNFGTLFSQPIDGQAYAQPLYKAALPIAGRPSNLAFVATEHDSVYAFDTDSPTAGPNGNGLYWQRSFIDPAHGITTIPFQELSTPDILPEIGITGTPVIDGGTNTLYVIVKTREVRGSVVHYVQKLHALDLATGADKFGGPYTIGDTNFGGPDGGFTDATDIYVNGTGGGADSTGKVRFNAAREAERMALQLIGNVVYVAYSSHADFRPYHGWVLGFDKTSLQPVKVFNTAPNSDGVGIWQSGGGLSVDAQGNIYFAVGNGFGGNAFDPDHGNYSESVLKLDPTPNWTPANPQMMRVADYFTPFNWQQLDGQDADLGSGGAMLLPDGVGSAAHPHLMVETGKQGKIYLIDRDRMGHFTAGGPDAVVQTVTAGQTGVWGNPAFFQVNATSGILYYHGSGDVLKGYRVTNGHIDDTPANILRSTFGSRFPGEQPSISADGISNPTSPVNGIVWELQVDNAVGRSQSDGVDRTVGGPAILRAFSATNFTNELYDSAQAGVRDRFGAAVKFTVPVVTNGHVLVATADHFAVLGLFPTATAAPAAPSNLNAQLRQTSAGPQIALTWTNPAPNPGADPTGIKIFRSTDGVTFTQIDTANRNSTTYTDVGPFQYGQRYFYRIAATNQRGDSTASNVVNQLVPIPPSVLTVVGAGATSVGLSWTAVANDHYEVERSTDGVNFTLIATVPAYQTSYTDTGRAAGLYTYRIHAFNANPTADSLSNVQGAWVGPTIDHHTPPTAGFTNATDLTINGSAFVGPEHVLRLTDGTPQTSSAFSNTRFPVGRFTTSFEVRLHEGTQPNYADGFVFVLQANAPTAQGQGGAGIGYQGIGHSVAVKFSTFQHTGDPSSSSTGLVLNGASPSGGASTVPSGVLLNSQNLKQIDLSYDGTNLAERIEDLLTHQVFTASFAVNIPQILGSDTAYVGFTGASGSGDFWELEDILSWQFTAQGALPGAPTNLRQTAFTSSAIDLAWNANSYNETGFQVERSSDGANFTPIGTTTATTFEDVGLAAGTYFYRVKAFNATGGSPYSDALAVSLPGAILTQDQDIGVPGDPGIAGRATFANSTYTITASGSDVWNTTDHFNYLYRPLLGDGEIVARLVTEGSADSSTKAGVMIRESLAADAKNAYTLEFPNPGRSAPTFQWRPAQGAATQEDGPVGNTAAPIWLRLVRGGNAFSGFWAIDLGGGNHGPWNRLGTESFIMRPDVFVGLAVTSHNNNTTIAATFDNVQILPAVQQVSHLDVSAAVRAANPGMPVAITVQALDPYNNLVSGYRGTVHFTSSDGSAGLPADYTFSATDNGRHTFSFTPRTLGRQTVTVTDLATAGIGGGTAVNVTNDPIISSFLVAGFPASIHTGVQGNFTVTAQDASGQTLTAYRGTVHFTSTDPRATLPADYTFSAADAGVHTFSATLTTLGTQSITATDLAVGVSGAQSNIIVSPPPAITTLRRSAALIIQGDTLTVSGTFTDGAMGQTHQALVSWGDGSANTMLSLGAGVFTFSTGHPYVQAGNFEIRVTITAADGTNDTVVLAVSAASIAPPAGLVGWWTGDGNNLTTAPDIAGTNSGTLVNGVTYAPGKVGNAFNFNGSTSSYVNIPDAPSLNATSATWDFWVKSTQTSGFVGLVGKHDAATSLNGVTIQMDQGVARIEVKGNGPTLLLRGTTRVNDGQFHHMALSFQSGGAATLYVDGQVQATGTAPVFAFNATPLRFGKMLDNFWTPLTGQLDEIHIFNRVLSAGEVQSLFGAGAGGQIKGVHVQSIHYVVRGFPSPVTAGTPGVFTIAVQNESGQTAAGYRGTVHFTSSDPQAMLPNDYMFTAADAGMHTFTATLKTAGTQSITGTDTVTASITGTQSGILVNPGPVTQLFVTGFPSPTEARAVHFFTVTVQDAFGNRATNYRGTVRFSSTDPQAILPPDFTFTDTNNGTVVLYAGFLTAGSQTLTTTDTASGVTGSQTVVVTPGAADHFTLTANPNTITAGQTTTVTVTAFDPYGNVATGYVGTVHFTSSDAQATLPMDYTFVAGDAGRKTLPVILRTTAAYGPGPQTVTATDTGRGFAATTTVIVEPAAATTFAIQMPDCGCATAGQPFGIAVFALDPYGNIDINYAGTVHFSSSDKQALLPDDHDFTLDGGVSSFVATLFTAGDQTITATDAKDPSITGTSTIAVAPTAATHFILTAPGRVGAGVPFNLTVSAYDPYGNIDFNYVGTVHFDSSDPAAVLPRDYTFRSSDGGVATFGVILNTPTDQTISATDTSDPTIFGSITINVFVSGGGSPGTGGLGSLDRALAGALIGPPSPAMVVNAGAPALSSTPRMEMASPSAGPLPPDEQRPLFSTAAHTAAHTAVLDSLLANWDGSPLPSLWTDDLIQARLH